MNCQEFVFQHTSGKWEEAGWLQKLRTEPHRLICRRCRAFARNNAQLSDILQNYKEKLKRLEPTPPPYAEPNSPHPSHSSGRW